MRIEPASLQALLHAQIDEKASRSAVIAKGLNAAPGAAAGIVVFDPDVAVEMHRQGKHVILVRPMTTPDDVHGMVAAQGILTSQGGATSHAAVVARGMGKPAVVGCESLLIDLRARQFSVKGEVVHEGDPITIDGTTGIVYRGEFKMQAAKLSSQFGPVLKWADEFKRLGVYANADTPEDAAKARDFGAEGIGLCRTEHMFMQTERLPVVQEMIMAETPDSRRKCLEQLLAHAARGFPEHLSRDEGAARHGAAARSAAARVLAEPRGPARRNDGAALDQGRSHGAVAKGASAAPGPHCCTRAIPCSALRVCRLGIVYPEIYQMQVRAIMEAAVEVKKEKIDVRPLIMIPASVRSPR